MGIIESHFHLHKKDNIESIRDSVTKYQGKIMWRMMCCKGYHNKLQPLNMIKDYLGEKVAFEHAFLVHYIGMLIYPAVLGLLLVIYQCYKYLHKPESERVFATQFLDTEFNAIYGIIVALWATVFVESWKNNQARLQYYWDCDPEGEYNAADEREEFVFYRFYNEVSDRVQKEGGGVASVTKHCFNFVILGLVALFVVIMLVYYNYCNNYALYKDKNGKWVPRTSFKNEDTILYYVITVIYSIGLTVMQMIFVSFVTKYTDKENHRYQK